MFDKKRLLYKNKIYFSILQTYIVLHKKRLARPQVPTQQKFPVHLFCLATITQLTNNQTNQNIPVSLVKIKSAVNTTTKINVEKKRKALLKMKN